MAMEHQAERRVCSCPHGPRLSDGRCEIHVTAGRWSDGFLDCGCALCKPPRPAIAVQRPKAWSSTPASRLAPVPTRAASTAERIEWTAEQQAARESVLDNARFRTGRHRRIYRLHVAGLTAREIGDRVGMHARNVEHVIAVYDRQRVRMEAQRLTPRLCGDTLASWSRYTWGQERSADRRAIEEVLARIRELPVERPTADHVAALPRAFRKRWLAAGLSEASTPAQVLKAAQAWPELAEHLRLTGLLGNPFADAAELPARRAGMPCAS